MSKKPCLRNPFEKQRGKRAKALLKSASQHLYHIHLSFPSQLSRKKSLFLTCQVLGLLVKTFVVDEKNPILNKGNSTIPIKMQLSQKQKFFSEYFASFLKSTINFKYFEKKDDPHRFCISEITDSENVVRWSLKSSVSEDPSTTNIVNVPKHCWNLHHSTFIIFNEQCQFNWAKKRLSYSHAKSWDCFLTHCLPMKSVLFLLETI